MDMGEGAMNNIQTLNKSFADSQKIVLLKERAEGVLAPEMSIAVRNWPLLCHDDI
jgi:hypothetical protein